MRLKYYKNKKASITDAIPVMVLIFFFGIVSVVSYIIYDGLRDNGFFTIAASPISASIEQSADNAFDVLDLMGALVFVGSAIAAFIGALLIRSHPAFFFISILVMLVQIVVGVGFANTWEAFITTPALSEAEAQFTTTSFFLLNLPLVIFVVLILMAIILYAINPFGV